MRDRIPSFGIMIAAIATKPIRALRNKIWGTAKSGLSARTAMTIPASPATAMTIHPTPRRVSARVAFAVLFWSYTGRDPSALFEVFFRSGISSHETAFGTSLSATA